MGEMLIIDLNSEGKCEKVTVKYDEKYQEQHGKQEGFSVDCNSTEFLKMTSRLNEAYFCVKKDFSGGKEPNAKVKLDNGQIVDDLYCGNIRLMTEGADVQFKSDGTVENRKCKLVGGRWICY